MQISQIVQEIDGEIARLTSARDILIGSRSGPRNGFTTSDVNGFGAKRGSRLTPAGRKKLSEMMKKRWAERRKKMAAKTK